MLIKIRGSNWVGWESRFCCIIFYNSLWIEIRRKEKRFSIIYRNGSNGISVYWSDCLRICVVKNGIFWLYGILFWYWNFRWRLIWWKMLEWIMLIYCIYGVVFELFWFVILILRVCRWGLWRVFFKLNCFVVYIY